MSQDPPENSPFYGVPPWLIVLLARKILSAMMFAKPNGQYYSINELADDLNFAFKRTPVDGEEARNTVTFTGENVLRMFNYMKRTTFADNEVELSRMASQIRRWTRDYEEEDESHPSYVVNKYITYGFVLTPNQIDGWSDVPFDETEKLEAFQFVNYHWCQLKELPQPQILATVFDYAKLMEVIAQLLVSDEYDSLLRSLAEIRSHEPGFRDYAAPNVQRPIARVAFRDENLRAEAVRRRSDFVANGPPLNGH